MSNLDDLVPADWVTPGRQQPRARKAIDHLAHHLVTVPRDRGPSARIFLPLAGGDQPDEKASCRDLLLGAELLQLAFGPRRNSVFDPASSGIQAKGKASIWTMAVPELLQQKFQKRQIPRF